MYLINHENRKTKEIIKLKKIDLHIAQHSSDTFQRKMDEENYGI